MTACEITAIFTPEGFILDSAPAANRDCFFDQSLWDDFTRDRSKALFNFGFTEKTELHTPTLAYVHFIAQEFVTSLARDSDIEITRKAPLLTDGVKLNLLRAIPYGAGVEFVNGAWLEGLWSELGGVFGREMEDFSGAVSEYLRGKNAALNVVGRVFFHLVENRADDCPFAFLATYSTGVREKVSHLPLKNALIEYRENQDKLLALLSTVSKVADKSPFISDLVESGELFSPLRFQADEAYTFLKEVSLYEECGVTCRIPDWWKKRGSIRVKAAVGEKAPSLGGVEALLSFNPDLYLGDERMSRKEVEALLLQSGGLSLIKGKWVEIDPEKLRAALEAFDKASAMPEVTFAEAMRLQLNIGAGPQASAEANVEITNGKWLDSIKSHLLNPVTIKGVAVGAGFLASLRPYQRTGLNWLGQMKALGFGSLLADDMGLGKTIQVLALLEYLRQSRAGRAKGGRVKTLLVIPASLLSNWVQETQKFAPGLKYVVIHAGQREFGSAEADLFITTYGMTVRLEALKTVKWDLIILDEAQAIKNPGTKQTKAVKSLQAAAKIALTGTPVENRLGDLWSIFDFLNQGLLGSAKEFSNFTKELKVDITGYARLREMVSPFILRRLKTDKAVIADLPDKVELKAFTELSKKQIVLYSALIKDLQSALEEASGIGRKGLVLAGIMKFKQICNHPDQYLGQNSFEAAQSGKFEKLSEICETIAEKRERVLVFTQFKEMTAPIAGQLEKVFGREGLILHGGTQVKKRGELVNQFNGAAYVPFMVLSLKAGGVGLNLTAANHVIHFDRWWNPAVENQATDRAFRIGQQKNVLVHKFITLGTIEEKIDAMIEEKQKMANDIIASSGENWITEMSNADLMRLFKLEVRA
ncbi:hypothetical protein FACS189460_3230 [Deltaproteobacteria bacterium]|nr:hypothetical protein FACS189460_3230 [Deltaproteobacteria bacterium]